MIKNNPVYLVHSCHFCCLGFDLASIANQPETDSIRTLHEALKSEYGSDDAHS